MKDNVSEYLSRYKDMYTEYTNKHSCECEDFLFEMPTEVLVGYFLSVHTLKPYTEACNYVKENKLSYTKGMEVKLLLSLLN